MRPHRRVASAAISALLVGVLAGLGGAPAAAAQEPAARISAALGGTVLDEAAEPVAGAHLAVRDGDGALIAEAYTDDGGSFSITLRTEGGPFTVTASSPSHSSEKRGPLRLEPGRDLRLDFHLTGQPIRLPAVEVVSDAPGALEGIPGSTHLIEGKLLETGRPASMNEILRTAPGVHVKAEDVFGLVLNIGVRGLDPRRSSRTLLLEDGAPIHLGPYGDPSARYHPPIALLERIEVLKGSGQILHGPHTVGGVVNFVTPGPPSRTGGSISLSGGSRDFLSGHFRLGGTWGGRGVVLDYARLQGRGMRAGDRHEVDNLALKGVLGIGGDHSLSLKIGTYVDDSRGGEAASTQAEFEADPHGNPFRHNAYLVRRSAAQVVHQLALGSGSILRTNLYGQRAEFDSWRQAGSSEDRLGQPGYAEAFNCSPGAVSPEECGNQGRPRTYTFWGAEPRLSALHRLFGVESHAELGARIHLETVDRKQFSGDRPDSRSGEITRHNEIRTDAFSLFFQNQSHLGNLTVTPGLRLEHVRSRNFNRLQGTALEDDYTKWLPGLGITWTGLSGATLFGGAHRGFAPPRPAEVLNPRPGEGLVQVDPEVSWNYELGARAQPVGGLDLEATLFRIDFDNQIVKGNLAGAGDLAGAGQTFVNAGQTLHQGFELAGALDLARLLDSSHGLYARAAYTNLHTARFSSDRLSSIDGETSIEGNRLPYAPEHLLNVTLGYSLPSGLEVRLDADHVSGQFSDDLNTVAGSANGQQGVIPAYTVFNAAASYPVRRLGVTFYVSIKNLTDRVYIADRQEGIVAGMPRMVTAGAEWSF